jgi:hypothetical protein
LSTTHALSGSSADNLPVRAASAPPSVAAPATEAQMPLSQNFTDFAEHVAHATGKPITFALCVILVLLWSVTGPIFQFSDAWQLVINTGTTIVTFLMVFLIQNTQNRDGAAI